MALRRQEGEEKAIHEGSPSCLVVNNCICFQERTAENKRRMSCGIFRNFPGKYAE
jgi:hypothetical protein